MEDTSLDNIMGTIGAYGYNTAGQIALGPGAMGGMPYKIAGNGALSFLPGGNGNGAGTSSAGGMSMTGEPFTQQVQNSMYSDASDMNSAAASARDQNAVAGAIAGGAAATDPSLAGERANSAAREQSDNADSLNKIQQTADVANSDYGLKEQGLQQGQEQINQNQQKMNMGFLQNMYGSSGSGVTGRSGLVGNSSNGGWGDNIGFLPETPSDYSGSSTMTNTRQGGPWGNGNNFDQQTQYAAQQQQNDPNGQNNGE